MAIDWLNVSVTKLPGDCSGKIKAANENQFKQNTTLTCFLCRSLCHLPKQKLVIIKFNNLNKNLDKLS